MPAIGRSAIILLATLASCRGDRPADKRPPGPTSAVAAQSGAPQTSPAAGLAVASEARSVCDSVAVVWRGVAQTRVAAHDTTVEPINRNGVEQSRPDEVLPPRPACAIDVDNDSLEAHPDSLAAARRDLFTGKAGWVELWPMQADGPDGGSQAFQRGLVRCARQKEWDGGDDADSTYVPSPFYREHTQCWRHDRAVIPFDTGHPPEA